MNYTTIALALFEFVLITVLSLLVVYVNYRLFIVTNADYDAEDEINKDNVAVAILLGALLIPAGLIVKEGIYPAVNMVRLYFTAPVPYLNGWQVLFLSIGDLGLVFAVAVLSMSMSL